MANIKSAIKRNRQNEKARMRNRAVISEMRTRKKAALAAAGAEDSDAKLKEAIRSIDKAATKGVIHKNKAARDKSRLIAKVASLAAAA